MAFPSLSLPHYFHLHLYLYLSLGLFIYSPVIYTFAAPTPDIESSGHPTQQQTPNPIQLQDLLLPMTFAPPSSTSTSSDSDSDSDSDTVSETDSNPHHQAFTISTVLNDPSPPYAAKIQCWRLLNSVYHTYPTVGKAAFLGAVSNLTYVVLPPHSQEGWHRPPAPMFFVLVSGEAHVSTPEPDLSLSHVPSDPPNTSIDIDLDLYLNPNLDTDTNAEHATRNLYITSKRNSVILALDTDLRAPGHLTFYPGQTETVALQIPLSSSSQLDDTPDGSGKRPLAMSGINYEVVKNGPCE